MYVTDTVHVTDSDKPLKSNISVPLAKDSLSWCFVDEKLSVWLQKNLV